MGIVRRAARNLIRSPLRTGGIIAILTVSVSLALIMLTVHGAAQNQLESVKADIGTDIQIRPAGAFGLSGGGEPLAEENVTKLSAIQHVVSVQESAQTMYTGDALVSAVEPGTLGTRWRGPADGGSPPVGVNTPPGGSSTFTMPISVMGFDPATQNPALMGDAQMTISEGRYFSTEEADADVLVVGQALAGKNSLALGSEVVINDVSVQVIGIFTTGQVFGDNLLVMPIGTVQRLFDIAGATSVTVVADSVDNVDGVVTAIREIFTEDVADVVTAINTYERINQNLVNAGSASQTGMVAAFLVAAVVILFSVVLMVRQRVREIGILKAIGASNRHIGLQFTTETLAMSGVAAVIGALVTFPLAQKVANLLVSSPTGPTAIGGTSTGGFARQFVVGGGPFGGGVTSFAGINIAVSPEVFLYALGMAIVLAVVASIFPSWYISRVKPAEVLRNE